MILALHAIRKKCPDILYSIVGDGERREFLADSVEREGLQAHVQFLGEVDDQQLLRCYQQCDLFVLPNHQVGNDIEGFGIVLLEAQSCGKAVVAGSSGGTLETMRVPATGRIVSCDSPDQLGGTVAELLVNEKLRNNMGRFGREWIVDKFDWDVLSRRAEEVFLDVSPGYGGAKFARSRAMCSSDQ
jgi:phosphatidylinositol alpha-1,6-mannosyltransferase